MNKSVLFLSALFALFISAHGHAQEKISVISTQQLVNECKAPPNTESRSFCIGFTKAVYETYLATRHPQNAVPFICINPLPRRDDIISGFVKWSADHPQAADKPAAGVFLGYLNQRYPCPKK